MKRPRLLDLFCGAGGAAVGYHRAGFDVVGVDVEPQPRYPFEFHRADAMTFPLDGFDAVHASPPCQGYSRLRHLPWLRDRVYPLLIEPIRARLEAARVPWVIENVMDAPMPWHCVIYLCGQSFGLPLYRHRKFASNVLLLAPAHATHEHRLSQTRDGMSTRYRGHGVVGVHGGAYRMAEWNTKGGGIAGHFTGPIDAARAAMGIDWMRRHELAQAIPPAYTEFIGRTLHRATLA